MQQKKFTVINEGFICDICQHQNPPATKTCRNHCQQCLCSKHVDINPGDRAEKCHGILRPSNFIIKGGSLSKIVFTCDRCGTVRKNKPADDDNKETIFILMQKLSGSLN